ncbi:FimV/HubP family polar landmark protein [Limnohabitans sp.]|uniref:type IV pilus assembly protein FimV n=1 Tax=Limnohabitans sp. TaxID=1907725 RepID=UPI00286F88E8|nr:FimV/HubP family polar landmark protein [Limnohabitans sp.]
MTKTTFHASRLLQRSALWAVLSLSLFGSAQALTLLRPVVQSKQGEVLRAEIDISEISPSERADLQVDIANAELYNAAKVALPLQDGTPLDIDVQLLQRANGKFYLLVTSKQAVGDYALDILIDLRWATGRLLRDFNVSLDHAKTTSNAIHASSVAGGANTQPLTVQRGDTASELVANHIPDGVSLEQMLLALLRNNPDAFVESNVNRIKVGALITLTTEQEAQSISRQEARREIQVQTKDFEAYRAELAARAPGGTVPKVVREAVGRLDAKVQNSAKKQQDKLTLSKPGSKDADANKIAQQREAQEVADRAAELSRSISELAKITVEAGTAASEPASGALPIEVLASAATANATANGEWLNELREHSLTPVGAGSLIAILVLAGLWRRRAMNKAGGDGIEGLPPLNTKFDLDFPEFDNKEPVERGYIHAVATHTHETHKHTHDHEHHSYEAEDEGSETRYDDTPRPTMEIPNISLDLDESDTSASAYQVRIDLADELWNLGQLHTSRALVAEVANEASGAVKEKALQWLAERA